MLDRAYARADRLSGGQQQRVAIARALAQDADAPTARLDARAPGQIYERAGVAGGRP